MIIRSISLKGVAGSDKPASFAVDGGTTRITLDPRSAAALPAVVMTLLYPEEVSTTEIARLAGPDAESAWRVEFDEEGTVFRVSRGFAPASIVLDVLDRASGRWERAAGGSSDVRVKLAELIKLPPPTVMEALNFWINVHSGKETASVPAERETSGSKLTIVGTDDFLGSMAEIGHEQNFTALSEEERRVIADEFRKTATIEFVEDQIRQAEQKLEQVINALGAVVDESGQLARITRQLSDVPAMRRLSDEERAYFDGPEAQLAEMERRLIAVDSELADAERANKARASALHRNPAFVAGLAATVLLTGISLFAGPAARRFALGNLVSLSFALTGFLGWLDGRASSGRAGRKVAALARRREQLIEHYERTRAVVDRLREELPVRNLVEYQTALDRRAALEAELAEVERTHQEAFASEEYQRLAAKKDRAENRLDALRLARRRLGESSVPSFELMRTLENAGVDPWVVLWRPDPPAEELRRRTKKLGQVASKYRLISEDGLNSKTAASWLRVAERIVGVELPELTLNAEHQLVTAEGADAFELFSPAVATALVESLRMSLHLTLVKAAAPGIHKFAIDVHPDRIEDSEVRLRLDKMYKGLGERLQVLVVKSP